MSPRPQAHEAGVSSVVAAVLLFALFTTVGVLYSVQTLPQWVADNEEAHQRGARQGLADLKAGLEGLSARKDPGPVSAVLRLGVEAVPVLQSVPGSAAASYEPGFTATATFGDASLHLVDGVAAGRPDVDVTGNTLQGVNALTALALALQTSGVSNSNDAAWVQVTASDGSRSVSLRIDHAGRGTVPSLGCQETDLRSTVTSTTVAQRLLQCGMGAALPSTTVDALDPALGFAAALAGLTPPWTLTFQDGASGGATSLGTFGAVWVDAEGRDRVAGSGTPTPFSVVQNGGRLVVDPSYQEYPMQLLSWEGGAVLAVQGDQQAVAVDPSFQLSVDGATGHLRWTLVQLTGSGHVAGRGAATVQVTHLASTDVLLTASSATFSLTTPEAAGWRRFLEDRAFVAGAGASIQVEGSGNAAILRLTEAGPVTAWTVHLRLVQASAVVS